MEVGKPGLSHTAVDAAGRHYGRWSALLTPGIGLGSALCLTHSNRSS